MIHHPRMGTPLACALAIAVLLPCTQTASLSNDNPDFRLPATVRPTLQDVRLKIDSRDTEYSGSVRVEIDVQETRESFSLHSKDAEITRLLLRADDVPIATQHSTGERGLLTVTPFEPIDAGQYTLIIDFTSEFGTRSVGLYRTEYAGDSYAFTQFEASDAREAFPCFDEPEFKMTWQLHLSVPRGHTAVTNTPAMRESRDAAWTTFHFAKTRPLPSYLIAIAAGPLEFVPIEGMSVPGRIVTPRGQTDLARYAAEMTPPILAALESYFGAPYPFAKLDQVAVPEFWPGAMEHPGAVTYDSSILLLSDTAASTRQRRVLARVVSHELAHQWFGNLVTMEWWDDLWLNESFAEWLGDRISHEVFPDFNVEVTELGSSMRVMRVDSRPSSTPIRQAVEHSDDLLQNLDLQYNKGKAVLGMFERWMGSDTFRAGVLSYLDAHAWGSATSDDLWSALSTVSNLDVTAALTTFIEQPGVPLITVELESPRRARLSQSRFHAAGETVEPLLWQVPIILRYGDANGEHEISTLLTGPESTVELPGDSPIEWVLPNSEQRGYYRWSLTPALLTSLLDVATTRLTERERVGMLANLSALVDAGLLGGDAYLEALAAFAGDSRPMVIEALLAQLDLILERYVTEDLEPAFASYVRRLLGPALERFGTETVPGESDAVGILRPALVGHLAGMGRDAELRAQLRDSSTRFLDDYGSIDPSLVTTALGTAALDGDATLLATYQRHLESASTPAIRGAFVAGLMGFRDPALVDAVLDYVLTGPFGPEEILSVPFSMSGTPALQGPVWTWFKSNYATIIDRVPPVYRSITPQMARGCSFDTAADASRFFANDDHRVPGTEAQLRRSLDHINECARLRGRAGPEVAKHLRELEALD